MDKNCIVTISECESLDTELEHIFGVTMLFVSIIFWATILKKIDNLVLVGGY